MKAKPDSTTIAKLTLALDEYRTDYVGRIIKAINEQVASLEKSLSENGWNLDVVAKRPDGNYTREAYRMAMAKNEWARKWTVSTYSPGAKSMRAPDTRTMAPDIQDRVRKEADDMTKADFESYVFKMAGKITKPVKTARLVGSLWSGSTLMVECEDGEHQTWTTRCIINCSVLGKLFNQWPTVRNS